jgi:hypothetical protein
MEVSMAAMREYAEEPNWAWRMACSSRSGGLLLACLLVLGAAGSDAASINAVPYASTGPNSIDFEDLVGAPFPGTNYDGIVVSGGVSFAERFVGQILGTFNTGISLNDSLSGAPSGPLTLQPGLAGQNLAVGTDIGTNGLYPCGPLGCTHPEGYGEGSVAILFSGGVSTFGFQISFVDAAGPTASVSFFRSDGSIIDTIAISGSGGFGFERDGATRDIRGVSIWTQDPGGLGYDNFTFGQPIPEPRTIGLFISGLAVTWLAVRRRRRPTRSIFPIRAILDA